MPVVLLTHLPPGLGEEDGENRPTVLSEDDRGTFLGAPRSVGDGVPHGGSRVQAPTSLDSLAPAAGDKGKSMCEQIWV